MKASKVIIVFLAVLFVVVVATSIFTLAVSALDNGASEDDVRFRVVCCGPCCVTGEDFCLGDGLYQCCE